MCSEQENPVESTIFYPRVKDSDGQSDSKHFDEKSGDYLPSNSHENQSEDDNESTDDGFWSIYWSSSSPVNITSVTVFVMYDIWVFWFFFLLLIEIISVAKLLIIAHFFGLRTWEKHLATSIIYLFFFPQFILWEHPFFCPNTENYLGLRGWCPWNYLV